MLAFVFPGQGSQYAGMGKELCAEFRHAREVFEQADDALGQHLTRLCHEGPEDQLRLTANTQPAILTTSIAALRVLQHETGLNADLLAGHSLGEYSALVAAGALDFADAVKIVRQRGTFMQEAVPDGKGAMAAVLGVDAETLAQICAEAAQWEGKDEIVTPANFNAPGQIVIAGHTTAVERALAIASERGAKRALRLPVSAPFHCPLMLPAGERLQSELEQVVINPLNIPVVSNVEASAYTDASKTIDLLVRQVSAPVRWDESVNAMISQGVVRFIEVGPSKVLCGLIRRIERKIPCANIEDIKSLKALE
ncbi:MAG: ACP S-malonyltransferase [Desulfuromonadaceae bacterium]|nr:ACP S-malonyltransferase [Desulfuromonadaceae bacterium]